MKRAFILAMTLGFAAPAHAGRWQWTAPESCPEDALRISVGLRADTGVDSLPFDVDIHVAIDEGHAFTATLVIGGSIEDSRTLTSASCAELTDALAIVIARLASVAPPPPPPAVVAEPAPVAVVEVGPVIARTIDEGPHWNVGARVAGSAGTGGAPDVGIAAELGAWGAWRSVSLELAVSRWKSNHVSLEGQNMAGVDVGLETVAVRAGWRPSRSRLRGWGVAELGSMTGAGVGFDDSRGGSARWSALGIGGAYAWPLAGHVALIAASELEFLIDRVKFTVDSGSVLYRTPAVGLRASLGFELGWR